VGNGDAGNGFVHVMVRIAPGRSDELRRRITTELFAALERVMAPLMQQQRLGLQLEVAEFDAGMTTYRNNLASSTDADEPVVEHRP
jgi:5-carboxymethyl-2-hydroxymuconate isomerase